LAIWLLIPAALFAYLAFDAWSLGSTSESAPYNIEANVRGEPLNGVPLREQIRRKAWSRRYGIGEPSQVLWVWLILAAGCLAGAAFGAVT
jgi:hypothetical protein